MNDLLVRPIHSIPFLTEHGLGVDRLIAALRELARHTARQGRTLCLENTMLAWGATTRKHWGTSREEWHQIYRDTARENVKLTLDTSHAVTAVQVLDNPADREIALWEFLDDQDAIWRVHWSDSMIGTEAGKRDMHLVPGSGDLPRDFHQAIKALTVPKLLEQKCTEAEVCEGLRFIATL